MTTTHLTPERHSEAAFEAVIEAHLLDHGYTRLTSGYDRARTLFPAVVIDFIKATQPKEWAKLEALHGANTAARVLDDLCKWLDTYGALHTLRHGFKCYGRTLRIAFFKAAHELNVDLEARYTVVDVTDFAFAASPDFKIETTRAGAVEVVLYYLPEHQSSVAEYIDSATGSLSDFSDWYGAYPHPRLTVVDVPNDATGAGGMEYPTLVTVGNFGMPSNSGIIALVTAHEIAHQWWPMQTATNEAREPWLDEGLAEYSGLRYLAKAGRTVDFFGLKVDPQNFERSQYDGARQPSTLPAWQYSTADYGTAVYAKTAMGLWTLEGVVGAARFRQALAGYVSQYRFKHPTGADFRAALERSLGSQSWFFDDYMNGSGVIDYMVALIETSAHGSIVRVRRVGEVRAPVEIRVTLTDGSRRIETWDGQTSSASFAFPADQPVKRVEIDPEEKLTAELERSNNSTSAAP